MNGDTSDTDGGDEVDAREPWSNDFSPRQTLIFGALMVFVGLVGLGMAFLSVRTLMLESGSRATLVAGLLGVALIGYAAYELTHL